MTALLINPAQFIRAQDGYKCEQRDPLVLAPRHASVSWRAVPPDSEHQIEQRYMINDFAFDFGDRLADTLWLTQQTRYRHSYAAFGEDVEITDISPRHSDMRLFSTDNSLKGFFGFNYRTQRTERAAVLNDRTLNGRT